MTTLLWLSLSQSWATSVKGRKIPHKTYFKIIHVKSIQKNKKLFKQLSSWWFLAGDMISYSRCMCRLYWKKVKKLISKIILSFVILSYFNFLYLQRNFHFCSSWHLTPNWSLSKKVVGQPATFGDTLIRQMWVLT